MIRGVTNGRLIVMVVRRILMSCNACDCSFSSYFSAKKKVCVCIFELQRTNLYRVLAGVAVCYTDPSLVHSEVKMCHIVWQVT